MDGERRAGVSSLGLGDTNAHVLVEPAPATDATGTPGTRPGGARTVRRQPGRVAATGRAAGPRLAEGDLAVADVAYTLAVGRRRLAYRDAVGCADVGKAVRG